MALNGNALGDEMLAAIDAAVAGSETSSPEQRQAIWRAVGNAIVLHITANATVAVNVVSVSGVMVGGGVSGPGVGTGTVS